MKSGAVVVGSLVLLAACNAKAPMTRVRVTLEGDDSNAAVAVVEQALLKPQVPGSSVRSVGCVDAAVVEVSMPTRTGVEAATDVKEALSRFKIPDKVFVDVRAVEDVVVVFAVRGADAVSARAFVDKELATPLSKVAGVVGVKVLGGRQERQVRVDLQKMLALDVSLAEVAQAAGGGASLPTTIVRDDAVALDPGLLKAAAPAPSAHAVKLVDVATIGLASAGEPLRRDGAVEVRVHGAPSARAAVIKAALAVARPAGVEVSALDNDSVEGADVLVLGPTPASIQEVQRVLLGVPGVRLADEATRVRVIVDEERARQLGVRTDDVSRVIAIAAGDGFVLVRNTENVVLRLERAVSVELMGQLVVSRSAAGPVRLLDVARIETSAGREDRLDGQPVHRLHVLFDVGVRKVALAALDQQLRSLAGMRAIIERDDVGAGLCP